MRSGFVQSLDGQGMPKRDHPAVRATLYVEYSVVFPVGTLDSLIGDIASADKSSQDSKDEL